MKRERESNAYRLRDGAGHCTADEFGQSAGLVMLRISPDKLNLEEFVRRKVESDIGSDACEIRKSERADWHSDGEQDDRTDLQRLRTVLGTVP